MLEMHVVKERSAFEGEKEKRSLLGGHGSDSGDLHTEVKGRSKSTSQKLFQSARALAEHL